VNLKWSVPGAQEGVRDLNDNTRRHPRISACHQVNPLNQIKRRSLNVFPTGLSAALQWVAHKLAVREEEP
jgi:hypothetical protein